MYEKEANVIRKKVFWRLLLCGIFIKDVNVKISDGVPLLQPLSLAVSSALVTFSAIMNRKKLCSTSIIELPVMGKDIKYSIKLFVTSFLNYKKKNL